MNAHLLINQALQLVSETVAMIEGAKGSHMKWLEGIFSEQWPAIHQMLQEGIIFSDTSSQELIRRIKYVSRARKYIHNACLERYPLFPRNPYTHWARHSSGRVLGGTSEDKIHEVLAQANLSPWKAKEVHGLFCLLSCAGTVDIDKFISMSQENNLLDKSEALTVQELYSENPLSQS